jgi:nicotinamide-nucleotide adenylyltransferase
MKKIGVVCRFKPVHNAHAVLLEQLCRRGEQVLIGIGSSNRYDARNPFSVEETAEMIDALLEPRFSNYELLDVPDLGHGPRWRAMIQNGFGELDLFVSANDYVRSLMAGIYPLAHPREIVPRGLHVPVDGTGVRLAMARGQGWEHLVPPAVVDVLHANELPERFRHEFGLATLSLAIEPKPTEEVNCVLLG